MRVALEHVRHFFAGSTTHEQRCSEREAAERYAYQRGYHLSLAERSKASREFEGTAAPIRVVVHRNA